MPLILYDFKMAPSPRRARIILALKQVPHEAVEIDMMKSEQFGADYRAINPNCTLPALQLEDGTVLTDNAGIAAWLEATYPEPPLLGSTALEKADIATWNGRIEMELGMAVAHALRNANPAMANRALPGPHDYEQIPALAQRGMQQIDHFFDTLEARLEEREFIAANGLSAADVTCFCFLEFAKVVQKQPGEDRSNIARWYAALREIEAFQR